MDDENKPRAFSVEEGVLALRQSREDQAEPEKAEDEAEEVETEEVETEEEAEAEPDDDQTEGDEEDESEPEEDDGELYEVGGETFTLSELKEWKANGLRQSDYTKKTQELAEQRKEVAATRANFEAEREQVAAHLRQQQAQLKDALATFAIEQDPEPSPDGLSWEDYTKRKSAWDKRQSKKMQARQAYEALQAQQHQETVAREQQQLLRRIPEWSDPETFKGAAQRMVEVGQTYGFTPQEMVGMVDHRMFLVLNDLMALQSAADNGKSKESAAAKKVTKAAKRLSPGAKPDAKNQKSKDERLSRERLSKTGDMKDAVAALRAKRRAQAQL